MRTILVIEDDPSMRQVLELFLEQMGYRVLAEGEGRRALQRLTELPAPPDLVITDLSLPGMDGLEILAAVRQSHPGLPVVLMTGFQSESVCCDSPYQPEAVLQKPMRLEELKRAIMQLTGKLSSEV